MNVLRHCQRSYFVHRCISSEIKRNFRFLRRSAPAVPLTMRGFLLGTSKLDMIGAKFSEELQLCTRTYASKKKRPTRSADDDDESSDEDDNDADETGVVSKQVPSLRIDAILKAGLGITNKQVEKEFYSSNVRLNEERILKKAETLRPGDEIDIVKCVSPDNPKFLVVDRIVLKSIGDVTGSVQFPVKLQVLKKLIIENYEDPWLNTSTEF